jgi:hypothetical protein
MRKTSLDAYNRIKDSGLLSVRRLQVYQILYKHGPMTAAQVIDVASKKLKIGNSGRLNTRLSELRRMGCVDEVDRAMCPVTGYKAIWWDVNGKTPIRLAKGISKDKKIQKLKEVAEWYAAKDLEHINIGDPIDERFMKHFYASGEYARSVLDEIFKGKEMTEPKDNPNPPKRWTWEEWLSENFPSQITSSSIRFAKSAFEDHNGLIEYQAARIKELEAENNNYKRTWNQPYIEGMEQTITKLQTLLREACAVIEFYGDENNWGSRGILFKDKITGGDMVSRADHAHGGKRAREFLQENKRQDRYSFRGCGKWRYLFW